MHLSTLNFSCYFFCSYSVMSQTLPSALHIHFWFCLCCSLCLLTIASISCMIWTRLNEWYRSAVRDQLLLQPFVRNHQLNSTLCFLSSKGKVLFSFTAAAESPESSFLGSREKFLVWFLYVRVTGSFLLSLLSAHAILFSPKCQVTCLVWPEGLLICSFLDLFSTFLKTPALTLQSLVGYLSITPPVLKTIYARVIFKRQTRTGWIKLNVK